MYWKPVERIENLSTLARAVDRAVRASGVSGAVVQVDCKDHYVVRGFSNIDDAVRAIVTSQTESNPNVWAGYRYGAGVLGANLGRIAMCSLGFVAMLGGVADFCLGTSFVASHAGAAAGFAGLGAISFGSGVASIRRARAAEAEVDKIMHGDLDLPSRWNYGGGRGIGTTWTSYSPGSQPKAE